MDYMGNMLLGEVVRFIEFCQDNMLKGKISKSEYYSLTKVKFEFVHAVLYKDNEPLFIKNDLRRKLNKININQSLIENADMKVVGK